MNFRLPEETWSALHLPIDLAFFLYSTKAERVLALYPSPAGATESLVPLEAWQSLVEDNPILRELQPDVEALLVNRIGEARDSYRVGIAKCYEAFGVEVVQRLMRRQLPEEVCVVDFGIRGIDVTYALLDGYETVILVDATPRGGTPGNLYLLELDIAASADALNAGTFLDMHRLDPMKVLRLAQQMGAKVERLLLVGCEPELVGDDENMLDGLSDAVRLAVDQAIPLIESLVTRLLHGEIIEARENPVHSLKEV